MSSSLSDRRSRAREVALQILAARFEDEVPLHGETPSRVEPESGGGLHAGAEAQHSGEARSEVSAHPPDSPLRLRSFQEEAAHRAGLILKRRRGVLISDSVGLGKTYIALALIEKALHEGRRVGVITPAALRRSWIVPLRGVARTTDSFPGWTSHTRLAMGSAPPEFDEGLDLIVVDEAHAFRNPQTRRYRALADLARSAELVLITATPVNNSPLDLYALIRLFAGDGTFRDIGIPDLAALFRDAADGEGSGRTVPAMQRLLRAIMIRRTREMVAGRAEGPGPHFPDRAPPTPIRYSLAESYPDLLPELRAMLASLTLVPYRLSGYGASPAHSVPSTLSGSPDSVDPSTSPGSGPLGLIRLNLLKRLESSLSAFSASIERLLHFLTDFIDSLDRGLLRLPAEHRLLTRDGAGEGLQLALDDLILQPIPPDLDTSRIRREVEEDRRHLNDVYQRLRGPGPQADPKLELLVRVLDDVIGGQKAVVFTEFRETAHYLWRALRDRGHLALINGEGAWLGAWRAGRQEVIDRFAPLANHRGAPPPHERVDLLIATDVLAEGLNLQDARHVISYDLPWNPVRLIQRTGRIDRLGSPHDVVYPYHFMPDEELDEVLHLTRRLHRKLGAIRGTIGLEGHPILGTSEDQLPEVGSTRLDSIECEEGLRVAYRRALEGEGGWDDAERARREWQGGRPAEREMVGPGVNASEHLLLIACRFGGMVRFLIQPTRRKAKISEDDLVASRILLAALGSAPQIHSAHTDVGLRAMNPGGSAPKFVRRGLQAARRFAKRELAIDHTIESLPSDSPGARAARRLLRRLVAESGPLIDTGLARRADRLLPWLGESQCAGLEARIARVLAEGDAESSAGELIGRLEEVFEGGKGGGASSRRGEKEEEFEIIGVIEWSPDPLPEATIDE